MMTIHEVSKLAGVSIRTLQYYDKIDLLHPSGHSDAGYRLYDDTDLERLQHILLFREMEFPLKDIKAILNSPDFDREKALEQQIELLKLKKEHIDNLWPVLTREPQDHIPWSSLLALPQASQTVGSVRETVMWPQSAHVQAGI